MQIVLLLVAAALLAVPAAAQSPPGEAPIPERELVRRLGAALDSLAARGEFSGVVLLGRNGAPVFERAYGFADREARRPNRVETAFNLGSVNKVFTATAVRQLARAGKLHLDSTLAHHWPDYPNPEVARRVTIRQLLGHTSGIGGDVFSVPPGRRRSALRHNRDYLRLFAHEPLRFRPGTRSEYSNAGYVVLGLLVERVSGEDYYDYVRRHVYGPAGMTRTAHHPSDSLPPHAAIGYTRGGSRASSSAPLRRNTAWLPGRGSAAGGGYSTARDLLRFLQALREERVPGGPPVGFGAMGGARGTNAVMGSDLPGGYDLVVLANLDPPAAQRVVQRVRGWLGADRGSSR